MELFVKVDEFNGLYMWPFKRYVRK